METLYEAAKGIGVDNTYLSKLENGIGRPSMEVLTSIVSHFALVDEKALKELWSLAGYKTPVFAYPNSPQSITAEKEVNFIMNNQMTGHEPIKPNIQVKVPENLPVLYTDSVWVTPGNYGLVFDFAQGMGPTNTQAVVARIGMSMDHAEALYKVLGKKLTEAKLLRSKKDKDDKTFYNGKRNIFLNGMELAHFICANFLRVSNTVL